MGRREFSRGATIPRAVVMSFSVESISLLLPLSVHTKTSLPVNLLLRYVESR